MIPCVLLFCRPHPPLSPLTPPTFAWFAYIFFCLFLPPLFDPDEDSSPNAGSGFLCNSGSLLCVVDSLSVFFPPPTAVDDDDDGRGCVGGNIKHGSLAPLLWMMSSLFLTRLLGSEVAKRPARTQFEV
jgi:hypothetical protein